jgi:hypothetical protein
LLGPGPRLIKKEFTGAAVSQRLRNTALDDFVLDLYLRGPEDDLIRVETYSPRFMYIYSIDKMLC